MMEQSDSYKEQEDYYRNFQYIHERLRSVVWNEIYENELKSRYYHELLKRHKKWALRLNIIGLVAVACFVIGSIIAPSIWLKLTFTFPPIGAYIARSQLRFVKINPLTQIRHGCDVVKSMLAELWTKIERGDIDERSVEFSLNQISKVDASLVTRYINDAKFTEDRKLNIKCAEESVQILTNNYLRDRN